MSQMPRLPANDWHKDDYLRPKWPDMAKAWREGVVLGASSIRNGVKSAGAKKGMGYGRARYVAREVLRAYGKTTLTRAALFPIAQKCEKAGHVNEASMLFDYAKRIKYRGAQEFDTAALGTADCDLKSRPAR